MMIPKIIHYCWFGHNPLPEEAHKCIASWKNYFPDYDIIEWNESNFDVNRIPYTKEAYKLKKYAFVSDYARMWILYHYGGLYFDTDVEVIRPIDDIILLGSFMGMEAQHNGVSTIAVAPGLGLGVNPGLGLIKTILQNYENRHFVSWDGRITDTIVSIVSTIMIKEGIEQLPDGIYKCDELFLYPPEYFCPLNYFTGEMNITENTRSIHHYAATWVNKSENILGRIKKRIKFVTTRIICYFT